MMMHIGPTNQLAAKNLKVCKSKSKMADGRYLENWKNVISQKPF